MSKVKYIASVAGWLVLAIWLSACGNTTTTATSATPGGITQSPAAGLPTQSATTQPPTANLPTPTAVAVPQASTAGIATVVPAPAGTSQAVGKDLYLDDHSNPVQVLRSYYNAINRHEFVRAYSYWNSQNSQPYAQFEQGYKDTQNVELFTGQVSASAAAGTTYYAAPLSLKATQINGTIQVFAGCVLFRFGNPANYGQPPFRPLVIDKAAIQPVNSNASSAQIMQQACQAEGAPAPDGPVAWPQPNDDTAVDASRYLDDRSSPEQLLRSYYNAINRHEYVRAYTYWATGNQLQPYDQFEKGFQNTANVKINLGKPESDPGAGQIYTRIPLSVTATQADKTVEVYTGCYTLHQSQPALFGTPPFVPIAISQAALQKVQNTSANTPPTTCR